jgi:hypothetical protein
LKFSQLSPTTLASKLTLTTSTPGTPVAGTIIQPSWAGGLINTFSIVGAAWIVPKPEKQREKINVDVLTFRIFFMLITGFIKAYLAPTVQPAVTGE